MTVIKVAKIKVEAVERSRMSRINAKLSCDRIEVKSDSTDNFARLREIQVN